MSLEYSMFRFSDDYPTAEGLSEMAIQVCMDEDRGDCESSSRLIAALVKAAYHLRYMESADSDEEGHAEIPTVHDPADMFIDKYTAIAKKAGIECAVGDAWWEDWWPTDCPWHPDDVVRLARLKVGECQSLRRQLREMFADNADCCESKLGGE